MQIDYKIEVKYSKNHKKIPYVNGLAIHSALDPEREALDFAQKNQETLKEADHILVFGLGFGYHLTQMHHLARKQERAVQFFVIEPNKNMVKEFYKHISKLDLKFEIANHPKLGDYFKNKKLLNFLMKKPKLILHPGSFNIYSHFFKQFLSYKSSQEIKEIKQQVQSLDLNSYLTKIPKNLTINEHIEDLKSGSKVLKSPFDFFILAYDEM